MLRSLIAVARSARPYLWSVILVNCLVIGASLDVSLWRCFLAGAILSCLASFGFLFNDLMDRKIDKLNNQGRLEDALAGTRIAAIVSGAAFAIAGLVLALYIQEPSALPLALSVFIGLVMYNLVLRRVPFVATALAAWLCASPFWFMMGLQFHHISLIHVLVLKMVVIGTFAREVMLDLKDVRGDSAFGRHTIPSLVGHRVSCILALQLTLVSCGYGVACLSRCLCGPIGVTWVSVFLLMMFLLLIRPIVAVLSSPQADTFCHYVATTRIGLLLIPAFVLFGAIIVG